MTAAADDAQVSRSGWDAGRVLMVVFGAIVTLIGAAILAGGGAIVWLDQTQRDSSGYLNTPTKHFVTRSFALVSDPFEVDLDNADSIARDSVVGRLRIQGESADSDEELFLGVARSTDVDRYLAGVDSDEVVDIGPGGSQPEYVHRPGGASAHDSRRSALLGRVRVRPGSAGRDLEGRVGRLDDRRDERRRLARRQRSRPRGRSARAARVARPRAPRRRRSAPRRGRDDDRLRRAAAVRRRSLERRETRTVTLLWFLIWFVSNLIGDSEGLDFDPVNAWAGTLLLAIALDLARQHVPSPTSSSASRARER